MSEVIIEFFHNLLGNDIATIIVIAIIPIIELRGAIPVGFQMGMPWYAALGWAYLGSMLVVPFLLLLLKPILGWMKKTKIFRSLAHAVEGMFEDKAKGLAKKASGEDVSVRRSEWIKILGVFAFVALPLPLTGVWTGSAVAVFLGLNFYKAFGAIMLGNLTAGAIVTLISVFFAPYLDIILAVFFCIVIAVLVLYIVLVALRMHKTSKSAKLEKDKKEDDSHKHNGD